MDPNHHTPTTASMDATLLLEPKLEVEPLPAAFVALDHLMPPPAVSVPCDPPRPLEALLQGPQLPPFLSKTYDLVSEPRLDGVISWGAAGNSFVVWDPSTFARDVLPHHFKHNNFSSFVRQLNTYLNPFEGIWTLSHCEGFRKVHADRWEFAHEDFLRHSKHLLKKIVRRRTSPTQQSSLQPVSSVFRKTQPGSSSESSLDPELHALRSEKDALLQEVARLKQEHRQTIEHMGTLNQRLESAEDRQKQMVSFLAKLLQNPAFLRQLKLVHRQNKEIDSTRVKRKFLKHVAHGNPESGESSSPHTGDSGLESVTRSPTPPGTHDVIADLQDFLLEDDLNLGELPDNIGLNGVKAPEDIGALVQGFDSPDELDSSGAQLMGMHSASALHGYDPTIGRSKGKNVLCPGLDGYSSETDCLGSFSDNIGVISGTTLETASKLMDADDEQIWGMDVSAAFQSSCSGSSQQAYSSLVSDPYLMEIANKPERFWEIDFQALDDGDLHLDKCVIDDPNIQQQKGNMKP